MQCQMCTKTDYNSLKAKKNKKNIGITFAPLWWYYDVAL